MSVGKHSDAFYDHIHRVAVMKIVCDLPQDHDAAIRALDDAKRLVIHLRDHDQEIFGEPLLLQQDQQGE